MNEQLLIKVIKRKRKAIESFTLEQMGIYGFFAGFIGLMLGELYSNLLNGLILHTANVILYAIIGAIIGYFNSKSKKEDLEIELMILEEVLKNSKQ